MVIPLGKSISIGQNLGTLHAVCTETTAYARENLATWHKRPPKTFHAIHSLTFISPVLSPLLRTHSAVQQPEVTMTPSGIGKIVTKTDCHRI